MVVKQKVYEMRDVHQIVEHVSAITKKAVILENADFELIAYSAPNEYSFDSIQQKTILTKRCPLYVIEHLKKEGIVTKLKENHEPLRVQLLEDTHFYQRLAISVQFKGVNYGYLWIYEADEVFDDRKLSLITEAANQLGEILHHEQTNVKDDLPTLLWKLVNEEIASEAYTDEIAKNINLKLSNCFAIAVISVKEAKDVRVLEEMKQLFSSLQLVYYLGKGTEMIVLLQEKNERSVVSHIGEFETLFSQTFGKERSRTFYIGVGNSYEQIKHIRKSYLEALEVIETVTFLNLSNEFPYFYEDIGMYRHLKSMYKKNVSEQYRNKKIMTLMDKDIKSKSELVKTLYCFLSNDSKVAKTAEDLFIHPNTLHYRIKQIEQLVQIDFTDVMEKTSLFTELYLIHQVRDYEKFYEDAVRPKQG